MEPSASSSRLHDHRRNTDSSPLLDPAANLVSHYDAVEVLDTQAEGSPAAHADDHHLYDDAVKLPELPPPRDPFYVTFMFLVLLGALSFPFCALVASPHFLVTYYNGFGVPAPPKYQEFWTNAPSIISGIFCVLNIPFQALAIRIRHIAPLMQLRVIFTGTAIVISVLPLCPVIFARASEESAIAVLMVVSVLLTTCSAAAQSVVFGLQAKFPRTYSVTASIGVGMSGLVAALLRLIPTLITAAPSPGEQMMEAHVFFGIVAVANLIAGIGAPLFLTQFPFAAHYYLHQPAAAVPTSVVTTSAAVTKNSNATVVNGSDASAPLPPPRRSLNREIWDLHFVSFMSMFGSYCMYPGVSARDVANDRLWGVVVFMAWNAGTTFGRTVCIKTPVPKDPEFVRRALVVMMVVRVPIIFGPALAGLYAPGSLGNGHVASTIVQAFSGVTNGFGAAYVFRIAANVLPDGEKPATMRLLVFAMACGVGIGCVIGMVLCLTA